MLRVTRPGGLAILSYTVWLGPFGGHEMGLTHYLGDAICLVVAQDPETLEKAKKLYGDLSAVLGLLQHEDKEGIPQQALDLLEERKAARAEENWARADELRDALKELGYGVEDSKEGAKLKKL